MNQGRVKFLSLEQGNKDLIALGMVSFSFFSMPKGAVHIRGGHRVGSSGSLYLPNTSASGEKEEGAVAGNLASKGGCIPQPFDRPPWEKAHGLSL